MEKYQYVFGPVPSRRLGNSLGVSPVPHKVCNYSCVYCQLGRTDRMTNRREEYFPLDEILQEFRQALADEVPFDVVTVVGEGEPTLYSRLGELLKGIKRFTEKPVAVITNSALMSDPQVRSELMAADIILPSIDAADEQTFKKIDRPYGRLNFTEITRGLADFSHAFQGQIWAEIMLVAGINDDVVSLQKFREMLKEIRYDRLYINAPVRPPAEEDVCAPAPERIQKAAELLGGISIDMLTSGGFYSDIPDDYEAILSIIRRHPMNRFEIMGFLKSRASGNAEGILERLANDKRVETIDYKGYTTFRMNSRGE